MTTYNTGNPIGSANVKDLYDNAENLDTAVNVTTPGWWVDRLGVQRPNIAMALQLASTGQVNTFYAPDRPAAEVLAAELGDGATVWIDSDEANGGVRTRNTVAGGVLVGGVTETPARSLGGVIAVDSIADLLALPESARREDLRYLVKSYHAGTDVGGGDFYFDSARSGEINSGFALVTNAAVNALQHGVKAVPGFDNRQALQSAINEAKSRGVPVYVPGAPFEYEIDKTVWIPSGTVLIGDGGRTKRTMFKAVDGHYLDMFVAGEHDEGVNHAVAGQDMLYRNGYPYTAENIGHNIAIRGCYANGNGDNAGYAPELGPSTEYRGCNFSIRYVSGVYIEDVFSEYAPNDCLHIGRCRRISVQHCELSRNRLKNFTGLRADSTRNLLTCAGTMAWNPAYGADSDYLFIHDLLCESSEDLGVAVQFVTAPGSTLPAGPVIITDIVTRDCATYGTAVEIFGAGTNQPLRELIQMDRIISIGDGWIDNLASVLVSHKSRSVNISNILIKNAGGRGLLIEGTENVNVSNVVVDGWGKNSRPSGTLMTAVQAYSVAPDTPALINISNIDVRNPGIGDTEGVAISGYDVCQALNVHVNSTTHAGTDDSCGIRLACVRSYGTNLTAHNCATNGIRVIGFVDFALVNCHALSNGRAASSTAQKSGIAIGAGTNRRGRVIGCTAHDRQTMPTQTSGILLGASATDSITVTGCAAEGNVIAPLTNLGMPNARVHQNDFDYVGSTLPLLTGGNGNYTNGLKIGSHYLWVEIATGKLRIKASAPTSDSDGTVVGAQS